jgi:hypothetical protein
VPSRVHKQDLGVEPWQLVQVRRKGVEFKCRFAIGWMLYDFATMISKPLMVASPMFGYSSVFLLRLIIRAWSLQLRVPKFCVANESPTP